MAKSFPGKYLSAYQKRQLCQEPLLLQAAHVPAPHQQTTSLPRDHPPSEDARHLQDRLHLRGAFQPRIRVHLRLHLIRISYLSSHAELKNTILGFLGECGQSLESVQQTLDDVHLFNKQFKMRDEVLKIPKVARVKISKERHS